MTMYKSTMTSNLTDTMTWLIVALICFQNSVTEVATSCPNVKGLGNPINIFHQYFRQTIKVFNPKEQETEVKLLYYREQTNKVSIHRFVFRLKNTYANRFEYVGIVSVVPKKELESGRNKHFIIRYINSSDLLDTGTLLGIYEAKKAVAIPCASMKQSWLNYLIEHPYVVTQKESPTLPNCVTSQTLTRLFSRMILLIQKVLGSFDVEVSTGQLGFDVTILDIFLDVFRDFEFVSVASRFEITLRTQSAKSKKPYPKITKSSTSI